MTILILSTSLNTPSKTELLGNTLQELMPNNSKHIPLHTLDLPQCDGSSCYQNEAVINLNKTIENATGFIICSPVYNYNLNAAAKNLIELTGNGWKNKVVGFALTAGGHNSYMAPLSFANCLMLDYRCLIIPRFVYTSTEDYTDHKLTNPDSHTRLSKLSQEIQALSKIERES